MIRERQEESGLERRYETERRGERGGREGHNDDENDRNDTTATKNE